MKGGFDNIMKQAQQMQENLQKAQEEIANMEVTGESGAGLVKVIMTGRHDVKRVEIDPGLLRRTRKWLKTWWPPPSMTPTAGWKPARGTRWLVSHPVSVYRRV